MEVNLTLHGEKGTLLVDCFGPNVYHNGAPRDRYTVQYTYFDEWIGLVDEFVDCVRNRKTPRSTSAGTAGRSSHERLLREPGARATGERVDSRSMLS